MFGCGRKENMQSVPGWLLGRAARKQMVPSASPEKKLEGEAHAHTWAT